MLDLVGLSREDVGFLRAVHLCERDLYRSGADLNNAIAVYVSSWLPTLHACNARYFEPPLLDVAWVWNLHKMDPVLYQDDCLRWFGHILDLPAGISPFSHSSSLSNKVLGTGISRTCIDQDLSERIAVSAANQSTFLWQINWPEYKDTTFLEESVTRYIIMLKLMGRNPNQFIVPTYDIDNIRHAHLAMPRKYHDDCNQLAIATT